MEEIEKKGKLRLNRPPFKNSIDYIPADVNKSIEYIQLLVKETELRNLQTAGKAVAQMREEIRTHLKAKGETKELIDFISEERA